MSAVLALPQSTTAAVISRDGSFLCVHHKDGWASVHLSTDAILGREVHRSASGEAPAAFRHHQFLGTTEVSIAAADYVTRFDLRSMQVLSSIPVSGAKALAYKQNLLFIGTEVGELFIFDAPQSEADPQLLRHFSLGDFGSLESLLVGNMDADTAYIYTTDDKLLFVDCAGGEVLDVVPADGNAWNLTSMANHLHHPVVATANTEGIVLIQNWATGAYFSTESLIGRVNSLLFLSNDHQLILVGDRSVQSVDFASDQDAQTEEFPEESILEPPAITQLFAVAETEYELVFVGR